MPEFAVKIAGVSEENQASWVLAVDRGGVLVALPDKSLKWFPLNQCTFAQIVSPGGPMPVVVVQPPPEGVKVPEIVTAREIPRNGGIDGP